MTAGARRAPTDEERDDEQTLFRASAVVALRGDVPPSLPANEQLVASRVDGFRPVARIKLKTGLTSEQFRQALRGLVRKQLLELVAIIEEAQSELRGLRDETGDSGEGEPSFGQTMPRAQGDVIPPHVMAEIEAMIEEEQRLANEEAAFDDETDNISREELVSRDADDD